MSFIPAYFDLLVSHLHHENRNKILRSISVTSAPEHWLSLEAAGVLDTNREHLGLSEALDSRPNVPRWLVAAERRKVDLWVEDQTEEGDPISVEFKVIHNNKNFNERILSLRRDFEKQFTDYVCPERWGIALLVYVRFYDDQSGIFAYDRGLTDLDTFLHAFKQSIAVRDRVYGSPALELVFEPVEICDLTKSNYIDPDKGESAIYMALVKQAGGGR